MKFIDDIRRENLTKLAGEVGGPAKLARLLNRSESQLNQWIKGTKHSATGRPRGMKTETARWIEQVTGRAPGWLDLPHDEIGATPIRHNLSEAINLAEKVSEEGLLAVIAILQSLVNTHPHIQKNSDRIAA